MRRGKQTSRAEAYHHRTHLGRRAEFGNGGRGVGHGDRADAGVQARSDALFVCGIFEGDVQRNDEAYVVFLAGVHTFFADGAGGNLRGGGAELFAGCA